MKGFSTKYALSKGIQEVEVRDDVGVGNFVFVNNQYATMLVREKTFFETRAEAEHNARQQATKKIASLEKQITKLKKVWG